MDGWLRMADAAIQLGCDERVVGARARRRKLPRERHGGFLCVRREDLRHLGLRPALADGDVYLTDIERDYGIPHNTLIDRAKARGIVRRRRGTYSVFSRADVPALIEARKAVSSDSEEGTPDLVDRVLAHVVRYSGIPAEDIIGESRSPNIVRARHLTCGVLSRAGIAPSPIGRAIHRDHSTVINSLGRVAQDPELAGAAADIAGRLVDVGACIKEKVGRFGAAGDDVVAYARVMLLDPGAARPTWGDQARALMGLRTLASRPPVLHATTEALALCGLGHLAGRIASQARQAGYRMAVAS